jgi:putative addiction module CopG family antidote
MLYRNVKLPSEFHDFIQSRVESGRYENASEVVRAALYALAREEKASKKERSVHSIAEGDVFRQLWEASASSLPKIAAVP